MEQSIILELMPRWDVPIVPTLLLALVAAIYVTGWVRARKSRPIELPRWRAAAFLFGVVCVFIAISSPLDTLGESFLFMHMAQHFVLMSIAPPLLVLGSPVVPLLRGMPRAIIRLIGPLFHNQWMHVLPPHPQRTAFAWLAMNIAYVGWHIPAAYEFALQSEGWHDVEHACFLFTSVLFWWPVVRPWPSRRMGSPWVLIPYLASADLVNTGLSAFLCFSGRVVYPSYAEAQRPILLSALNDQIAAVAFMWVFGSLVFLIPVAAIIVGWLSPRTLSVQNRKVDAESYIERIQEEAV